MRGAHAVKTTAGIRTARVNVVISMAYEAEILRPLCLLSKAGLLT